MFSPIAAKTTQKEEFLFQNVTYRFIVYSTWVLASYSTCPKVSLSDLNQNKVFRSLFKKPWKCCYVIYECSPKYLCIAFGILFLVMLLVNVYLCCAITGSAKICCFPGSDTKDKSFDKRGSSNKPDEFDPYARSWHGSQYGSR